MNSSPKVLAAQVSALPMPLGAKRSERESEAETVENGEELAS